MPPTAIIPYPAGFVAGLSEPVYINKRTNYLPSLDAGRHSAGCVALLLEPLLARKFLVVFSNIRVRKKRKPPSFARRCQCREILEAAARFFNPFFRAAGRPGVAPDLELKTFKNCPFLVTLKLPGSSMMLPPRPVSSFSTASRWFISNRCRFPRAWLSHCRK